MKKAQRILLASVLTLTGACSTDAEPLGDDESSSFGGNAIKADGSYEECVVLEVLELVNEATSDVSRLQDLGLRSNAAENIVAHRHGPDGLPGTGDDDIFDDLQELDGVRFVGPVAMETLTGAVADRCEDDLDSRPYMDATTFAGSTGGGWSRDNTELEATYAINGVTGQRLRDVLLGTDSRDRTIFSRVRKSELMEAFTLDYDIDEMPWDRDSHEAREALPFVPLTIEPGRYDPDEDDGGPRELSLGTDINDDIYYDTDEFSLLDEDIVVRGRVRHDGPDEIRRLLIAAKFGGEIGEDGIKRTGKVDVRTDNPDPYLGTFEDDVRRGMVNWSGSDTPVAPLQAVWNYMNERDLLPDIAGRESVLLIEPMVHLRSTRSRYHMNIARRSNVQRLIRNGDTQLQAAADAAQAALDAGTVDSGDVQEVMDFITFAQRVLSGEELAERLMGTPAQLPVDFGSSVSSLDELNEAKRVTEQLDAIYHEAAELLDGIDRDITGTRGLDWDQYVDMFVAWARTQPGLSAKRALQPFYAHYQGMDGMARDAFAAYATAELGAGNDDFEDWEGLTDAQWDALGAHLQFEALKHGRRQIEYAGTVGHMMWFDLARAFYVPSSRRPSGNFLIDTFDMTEMVTHEMWGTMTEDERRIDGQLDPAKVYHTVLVNEVQIELGQETEFVARISDLTEVINGGMGTAEDMANLEGARFILDQYVSVMQLLAELKGDDILDRLEDEGAPNTMTWSPAEYGKGETSLRLLADLD